MLAPENTQAVHRQEEGPKSTEIRSVQKEAYSIDEFAEAFGIGRTSVFKLIKIGRIRPSRILGRTIILSEERERFRASLQEQA